MPQNELKAASYKNDNYFYILQNCIYLKKHYYGLS